MVELVFVEAGVVGGHGGVRCGGGRHDGVCFGRGQVWWS